MKEIIRKRLKEIEERKKLKILFAVESGSRTWGFSSKDSDYDLRFVYIRPLEWYLSIEDKRDVVEYPISDLLDISGWDLQKALYLFRSSNPSLLEWLRSPIIYLNDTSCLEQLKALSEEYFSVKANIYHYLNMANSNYSKYLEQDKIKIKKHLYILKALLSCRWLENNQSLPPLEFEKLLRSQLEQGSLYKEIEKLVQNKISGNEIDLELIVGIIDNFIESELEYYQDYVKSIDDNSKMSFIKLNQLFRDILVEAWW